MIRMLASSSFLAIALSLLMGQFENVQAQGQEYLIRHYDHRDGLPQNTVNDIVQDEQGFLWIATFGGLARFDGFNFEVFDIGNRVDLPSNRIFRLCLDPVGGLWVGTQDAGLVHFDGDKFEQIQRPDNEDWGLIKALCYYDGALWIGHGHGLSRLKNGCCEDFHIHDGRENVYCLLADRKGRLLVGSGAGLVALTQTKSELEVCGPYFDAPVFQVWEDLNGRVFFNLNSTVNILGGDFEESLYWEGDNTGSYWSACGTNSSETWVGGFNLTTLRAGDDGEIKATRFEGLSSSPYRSLFQDREDNLWVGASGSGLYCLSPKSFTELRTRPREKNTPAVRLCVDNGDGRPLCLLDTLVVGEPATGELISEPGLPLDIKSESAISGVLRRGESVLATTERGLLKFLPGKETETLIDAPVSGILEDKAGSTWVGGQGVLYQIKGGVIESRTLTGVDSIVTPIQEGRKGGLWLVSRTQVVFLDQGIVTTWGEPEGVAGPIRTLMVDEKDRVWISSYGRGLSYIDGKRVGRITAREGLCDDSLGVILPGDKGALWINSNRGVFSLTGEELDAFVSGRSEKVHALRIDSGEGNGPSGFKSPDGTLWFPAVEALVGIEPEAIRNRLPQIATVLTSVTVGGRAVKPADGVAIRGGLQSIGIAYTAIHLRNPTELRFRYRLVGKENDWQLIGSRREVFFGGLEPGDYEFQIEATIAGMPWPNTPSRMSITIEPELHQSVVFWLIIAIVTLFILFYLYSLRIRKLEEEHQRETDSLALSAQRAEDRMKVARELEEAKRFETVGRLAGSIAHDFNNILMAQMGHAELIRFEDNDDAREQINQHVAEIIRSSNRAARLVRQIMDFSQDHRKKLRPVRLHVILDRVIPFLGPLLPADIRLSVDVSDDASSIEMDESTAEQLLLNLVLNARDAMPHGGKIAVEAEVVGAEEVRARGHGQVAEGRYLCLSVADNGQGIAREHLDSIFDSFFTTKARGKGTGLGLVTVKSLVESAGGFIRVDTEVGVGTRFSIYHS